MFLKAENFQRIGAFKFRGAYNAISRLSPEQLARGVVALLVWQPRPGRRAGGPARGHHGDHPDAGRRTADQGGGTRGYGAEVVTYDRYTQDRAALATELAEERGLTLIPPYDHYDVMAGQGTVALELIEEVGPLGALLVPVGGGGLIAGCATAATALSPGIRMIGVEPAAGDDHARSLAAGERVDDRRTADDRRRSGHLDAG